MVQFTTWQIEQSVVKMAKQIPDKQSQPMDIGAYHLHEPYDRGVYNLRKKGLKPMTLADIMRARIKYSDNYVLKSPQNPDFFFSFMEEEFSTSSTIALHNGILKVTPESQKLSALRPSYAGVMLLEGNEFDAMDGKTISEEDYSDFWDSYREYTPRLFSPLRTPTQIKRAKNDPIWLAACDDKELLSDYVDMIWEVVLKGKRSYIKKHSTLINNLMQVDYSNIRDSRFEGQPAILPLQISRLSESLSRDYSSHLKAAYLRKYTNFAVNSTNPISLEVINSIDEASVWRHLQKKGYFKEGRYANDSSANISGAVGDYSLQFNPDNYLTVSPLGKFTNVSVSLGKLDGKTGIERQILIEIVGSIAKERGINTDITLDNYHHSGLWYNIDISSGITFHISDKGGIKEQSLDALVHAVREYDRLTMSEEVKKLQTDTERGIKGFIGRLVKRNL